MALGDDRSSDMQEPWQRQQSWRFIFHFMLVLWGRRDGVVHSRSKGLAPKTQMHADVHGFCTRWWVMRTKICVFSHSICSGAGAQTNRGRKTRTVRSLSSCTFLGSQTHFEGEMAIPVLQPWTTNKKPGKIEHINGPQPAARPCSARLSRDRCKRPCTTPPSSLGMTNRLPGLSSHSMSAVCMHRMDREWDLMSGPVSKQWRDVRTDSLVSCSTRTLWCIDRVMQMRSKQSKCFVTLSSHNHQTLN
jgi:hypothetical protein